MQSVLVGLSTIAVAYGSSCNGISFDVGTLPTDTCFMVLSTNSYEYDCDTEEYIIHYGVTDCSGTIGVNAFNTSFANASLSATCNRMCTWYTPIVPGKAILIEIVPVQRDRLRLRVHNDEWRYHYDGWLRAGRLCGQQHDDERNVWPVWMVCWFCIVSVITALSEQEALHIIYNVQAATTMSAFTCIRTRTVPVSFSFLSISSSHWHWHWHCLYILCPLMYIRLKSPICEMESLCQIIWATARIIRCRQNATRPRRLRAIQRRRPRPCLPLSIPRNATVLGCTIRVFLWAHRPTCALGKWTGLLYHRQCTTAPRACCTRTRL